MGICCTRALMFGWMMAGRNAAPWECQKSTPHGLFLPNSRGYPARSVKHPNKDGYTSIVEGTEEPRVPRGPVSMIFSWLNSKWTNNSMKETEMKCLESVVKEKTTQIDELRSSQQAQDDNLRELKTKLDEAYQIHQEIREASDKEAQHLKSILEEKEKDLEAEKFNASQFKAKCLKQEAQLAQIEKKAAQESQTSGSYSDDHANPGLLEGACKAVDKATDALARFLHNNSVTKVFSLHSPEMEQFVRRISPAHAAELSRAIQVKNVWAHWICTQMFQGFEHVFFETDGGQLNSPLDSKKHALECFQRFQQSQQSVLSSGLFQAFGSRKYGIVFPPGLLLQAFIPPAVHSGGEFQALFMDVARAVWLLHEMAFSFDPPASILRIARGTPYDKQFHESVIHGEDGQGMSSQVVSLMIRPTFQVRKSIIRSRVFLCNSPIQA